MNKKFTRVISLILSVMMIFACAVTAGAEEAATPSSKIDVSIRVEGCEKNLDNKHFSVEKLTTLKAAIDAAGLEIVYAEDGLTIKSVKGEAEKTTSKWQYAVNGVIVKDKLNAFVLKENSEIILYNATEDAVIPMADATDAATGGVVTFYSVDSDGKKTGIAGATVKWEKGKTLLGVSEFSEYKTDAKGRILISDAAELRSGDHAVEIIKTNAYDGPEVVRMSNMKVNVPELENLFEEIYDFLYTILKGVVEVWGFYINAILGLFGLPPIESLLGEVTTPAA